MSPRARYLLVLDTDAVLFPEKSHLHAKADKYRTVVRSSIQSDGGKDTTAKKGLFKKYLRGIRRQAGRTVWW